MSIMECMRFTAALLSYRKRSHGSGARIRVTPFELQREKPLGHWDPGCDSSHRFGAFGAQTAGLVIIVVSDALHPVHCVRKTLVRSGDGGDQRNPSDYSTEYASNNISS